MTPHQKIMRAAKRKTGVRQQWGERGWGETIDCAEGALANGIAEAVSSYYEAELAAEKGRVAQLEDQVKVLRDALPIAKKGLEHDKPGSCWATGPMTGDPIEDLVVCPGCRGLHAIDKALKATEPKEEKAQ